MKMNLHQLSQAHGIPSPEPVGGPRCFRIIRFFRSDRKPRTIKSSLTETEAQAHCSREDTHGPGWFDGQEWKLAFQSNRYPRHGFEYCVSQQYSELDFETLIEISAAS